MGSRIVKIAPDNKEQRSNYCCQIENQKEVLCCFFKMSVMEGSLSKWTNVVKGWQYRWFVLDENAGLLSYYTSKEKMMRGVRRGCVRLKAAVIGIDDEDESTFTITVDHKTFHFQARDGDEREKWVRALEDTILRHVSRARWESSRPQPTIKDFDNKVAEADAYLQIMIEQTKSIEQRIPTMTDVLEQDKYKLLTGQSNAMLDDIKHSIVLLQIAKNTAYPVNGIYQGPSVSTEDVSPIRNTGYASPGQIPVETGIELATDCMTVRRQSNVLSSVVPETSYSSSEGEDDFYDAHDDPFTSHSSLAASPTGVRVFSNDETQSSTAQGISNAKTDNSKVGYSDTSPTIPTTGTTFNTANQDALVNKKPKSYDDCSLDYDALYEDIEDDASLMEVHGSVISHLISQIKIGMDLTKVVLPTFILERRSLLEMYADYFAHPDLFLSIADIKDPKDRMVQVVKWYMSSYHAGRKSAVAKKPYNPILGEVFKCHWDVTHNNSDSTNIKELVEGGPIPWCSRDQLTFVAEQVSHHPPISAFYAEHYNKRISFCAYVYTKSKFLGLSVCVYNIGVGRISLLDYNEEYTVTFPNGYGRSILTVPWIELGGSVKIECQQTGYHADIEFLTKPFYSNKKHKITADVFGPTDPKTPFLKIAGEWNGLMEAKLPDGQSEVFIDVNKLSVIKKIVEPISEQEENESRRVWKEVTAGLKFNDIDKATRAKSEIEDRQRTGAKERAERNIKWETKLFQPDGDSWFYSAPLAKRLGSTQS